MGSIDDRLVLIEDCVYTKFTKAIDDVKNVKVLVSSMQKEVV
jgi:hypothetical protein